MFLSSELRDRHIRVELLFLNTELRKVREVESLSCRDVVVLSEVARKGRARYQDLVSLVDSVGALYVSLSRLTLGGYLRKVDRGTYEITTAGIELLSKIAKLASAAAEAREAQRG